MYPKSWAFIILKFENLLFNYDTYDQKVELKCLKDPVKTL